MSERIVVFGATGYTGDLVSRALVQRGAHPVLAARNEARVRALAEELGGLEWAVADVERPDTVRALVERGDVLVSTVGPFARWGEPAVQAAIAAGAHYLDSTGEGSFIRDVFERFGPGAQAAGCGLVTAFGYDWVPGNLAGALALRDAGEAATLIARAGLPGNISNARPWRAGCSSTRRPPCQAKPGESMTPAALARVPPLIEPAPAPGLK